MKKMLMLLGILFSAMPLVADTEEANGYTWTYRINGDTVEIFKGSFTAAISPLPVGAVTIPSTLGGRPVTSIGNGAFNNCDGITNLTIPDGVTSIGDWTFQWCSNLTSVTIPSSLTSIGNGAFNQCRALMNMTIPDSVTNIGTYAFNYCMGLTNVAISCGVTSIGSGVFAQCVSLSSVTIPSSVTSIGTSVFSGCSSLSSIALPDGVTTIGGSAFDGCSSLTAMTIPDGVTSIGDRTFYSCRGLKSVTIGNGVRSIGSYAFYYCSAMTNVNFMGDAPTSVGSSAFSNVKYGCVAHVRKDSIGWGVAVPGRWNGLSIRYFDESSERPSFTIVDGVLTAVDLNGVAEIVISKGVTKIGDYVLDECADIRSLIISGSVTNIGTAALRACTNLVSVTIPSSVTRVGNHAFFGCKGLTSVTIPDSVTDIGVYAFCGCFGLKEVTIGSGVTNIGMAAFYNCGELSSVMFRGDAPITGSSCFSKVNGSCIAFVRRSSTGWGVEIPGTWNGIRIEYNTQFTIIDGALVSVELNGETDVIIPDGVTSICEGVFSNCTGLVSITIPNSVTNIGKNAFYGCNGLREVHITDLAAWCGVSFGNSAGGRIFHYALYVNDELATDIVIPDGVTTIDDLAFSGCTNIVRVTIPDGVTNIGNGVFVDCKNLVDVLLPHSVTNIGNSALCSCENLALVTIPDGVTRIRQQTFWGCWSLKTMVIGQGVTSIEPYAFFDCSGMTSVTIPDSVVSIQGYAFGDCYELTNVIFWGNAPTIYSSSFSDVKRGCTVYVKNGSTGWRVAIPGTWNGLNIQYLTPEVEISIANEAGMGTVEVEGELSNVEVASGVTLVVKGENLDAAALAAKITPRPHEAGQSASFFKVKAEAVAGGMSLSVVLDEEAVDPDETAGEIVDAANMAAFGAATDGENVSVSLPSAKPGLYYGIAAASDLSQLDAAAANAPLVRAGADGVAVPVAKPAGGAAFFKVIVSDRAR